MLSRFIWTAALPLSFVLQACGAESPSQLSSSDVPSSPTQDHSAYYAGTSDKEGEALRVALHDIIKGHKVYGYGEVFDILKESDRDPNNPSQVILFYTGLSAASGWNREHVWAKSLGFPSANQAPYTDAHHLRPCNVQLNSTRSNKQFAEIDAQPLDGNGNKVNDDFFEPADSYKGDAARIILYMDVRYDGDSGNEPELVAADEHLGFERGASAKVARFGKLSDLLKWNEQDPVDEGERRRNDSIHSFQQNRNPFIDHPEFVSKIWGSGKQSQ